MDLETPLFLGLLEPPLSWAWRAAIIPIQGKKTMNRLLLALVLLIVGVVALGFYRQWFHVSATEDNQTTNINVRVDKGKVNEDKDKVKETLEEMGEKVKGKAEEVSGKVKGPASGRGSEDRGKEKEEYRNAVEAELEEFDSRLDELKAGAEKADPEARTALDRDIEEVSQKREVARKKLQDLKAAGAEAWEGVKSALDAAVKDLRQAYDRAVSRSH
jgi:DNA repair exonuclease SbcCD ATPase subunit